MQRPKVGIAVIVIKDNMILLGKRKNCHGVDTWATPGGHLEYGESFEQCAIREVNEETGLEITNVVHIATTNDIFVSEKKHYVSIFMRANYIKGEPKLLEPDKCYEWKWFELNNLPTPLFLSLQSFINKFGSNKLNEN